jgi:repressor LexA
MIEAHIMPKDVVVVKEQRTAQNGDLVAFLLGDEATIKHIQFLPDCIRLMPANAAYDPIEVRSEESQIIGKVIGLIRNYDGGLSF